MSFDVPKVVRSPGCDHRHDEESRNGRDMKIDILEAYIRISEVFRVKSGFYQSTEGLPEPPGGLMGHSGPLWRRGEAARAGPRAPPPLVQIGQGEGVGAPFPSSLPPLSFSTPNPTRKREGVLLPVGVGLLLARPLLAGRTTPLAPLYTGAGGTLETHN